MKKILFTANTSKSMVLFRLSLLKDLISKNYEVYVVSPKDDSIQILQDIGCKYFDIKMDRKGVNPFSELKLIYNLYKIYKNIRPDIIFNYTIKPMIYGSIVAKMAKIDSVAVNIGLGYTFINNNIISKISKILYKISLKYPIQVWFINDDDKNYFIKLNLVKKNKTFTLPSEGVNVEKFYSQEKKLNNKFQFLLIARILIDKGIMEYIEAAALLRKKYNNIEFCLLGPIDVGNPKGIKENVIEKFHKNNIINYLGTTDDVRPFIANSNCIVLPSYREGKGMALIEAGAMQKPLIATNVPGCKDIVVDNFNGFLCEVKNSMDLSKKMEKMYLLDKKTIEKFGKNSRKYMIKNFDEKKVIKVYNEFLENFFKNERT